MPWMKLETSRRGRSAGSSSGSARSVSSYSTRSWSRAKCAPRQTCGPVAEGDVRVGRPGEVQAVRGREGPLVVVGARVQDDDLVARRDLLPRQLGVAGGGAPEGEHGRVPAQEFLDRGVQADLAGAQPAVLVRVLGEGEEATRGGAAYGVVARDGQQEEEHLQLVPAEPGVAVGGVREGGHHVVAGAAALELGELLRVVEHLAEHRGRARIDGPPVRAAYDGGRLVRVLVADDALGPVQQQPPVARRDAEQVGEVQQRVVVGDGGHQVDHRPRLRRAAPSSSRARARARCSKRSMPPGVKARLTRRRRRPWSGGSWLSIMRRMNGRSSGSGSRIWVAPRCEE